MYKNLIKLQEKYNCETCILNLELSDDDDMVFQDIVHACH